MVTVLLADGHEVVRRGLHSLLDAARLDVVAEAEDGKQSVTQAIRTRPDVAVIEYSLPLLCGLEVARHLRHQSPNTCTVIYTNRADDGVVGDLLSAGVKGYVTKDEGVETLIQAINSVAAGRPYFGEYSLRILDRQEWQRGQLSPRELTVLHLVAEGYPNKKIASTLLLSVRTVEAHRKSISRKLKANSIADLVRCAVRHGIVAP